MPQPDQLYIYYPMIGPFLESASLWATYIGTESERTLLTEWSKQKRKGNYLYFSSDDLAAYSHYCRDRKITDLPWRSLSSATNANSLGALGYLLVSCNNGLQACKSIEKYSDVISSLVTFKVTEDACFINLEILPSTKFPRVIADNIAVMMVQFIGQFGGQMIGDEEDVITLELTYPEDGDVLTLLEVSVDKCTFNASKNRFRIPIDRIGDAFPFANTDAQNMAVKQIHELRTELLSARTISSQISQRLTTSNLPFPSMEEIADNLHITTRTLQRRLASENTNYRELLNAAKIERAIHYMTQKGHPPKQTAFMVGFKDASSFTKAFKRYTGKTPSDYLKQPPTAD